MQRIRLWLIVLAWSASGVSIASGQSLLEQLEKKVREGLELAAPKPTPVPEGTAKPTEGDAGTSPTASGSAPGDASAANQRPRAKTPPPPPIPQRFGPAEELPAPTKAADSKKAAGRESNSAGSAGLPSGGGGKPFEAPKNDLPASPGTAAEPVFLGLEAESLTGGGIGTRVVSIIDNSPAWRAGFRVGDIILALDGHAIAGLDAMVERLALKRPGQPLKALVMRGGKNVELTAVLQNAALAERIHGYANTAGNAWLGVAVADLSSAFRNQFSLKVQRAAAVTNVTKGSPADAVRIQPGDAIIAVDGLPIESSRALLDWIASKRAGDAVAITVMRGSRPATLSLTLGIDPKSIAGLPAQQMADPFSEPTQSNAANSQVESPLNIVPAPLEITGPGVPPQGSVPAAGVVNVDQLRGELQSARQQLSALEQRIAEIEALLRQEPR